LSDDPDMTMVDATIVQAHRAGHGSKAALHQVIDKLKGG
jgi:hypothetical protein